VTPPRIHTVYIVPAFGHSDALGAYTRGQAFGRYCEMDVVDGYLHTLTEELDSDGIRFEVMPTRRAPGVVEPLRYRHVEPHSLVLHLCSGVTDKAPHAKNISHVYHGGGPSKDIALEISDAVFEWGQCTVFGHRKANPCEHKNDPLLTAPGALGVRIEPFLLNGPDAGDYMTRLANLGVCIGRAVSSYLMVRSQARARGVIGIGK